jgi:hypothetical protein
MSTECRGPFIDVSNARGSNARPKKSMWMDATWTKCPVDWSTWTRCHMDCANVDGVRGSLELQFRACSGCSRCSGRQGLSFPMDNHVYLYAHVSLCMCIHLSMYVCMRVVYVCVRRIKER